MCGFLIQKASQSPTTSHYTKGERKTILRKWRAVSAAGKKKVYAAGIDNPLADTWSMTVMLSTSFNTRGT
jgi:hypothetical protein